MKPEARCNSSIACEVQGNVVWLTYPAREPKRPSTDPITALKQSVAQLSLEIERSAMLRTDIATAVRSRRYEQYKCSTVWGARAAERDLVAAQHTHLDSLVRFVHVSVRKIFEVVAGSF